MKRIVRHDGAQRDLVNIFRSDAREAGFATARRFLERAEATFTILVRAPGIGTAYDSENAALADVRVSRVSRFKNYLVFYRPISDGIEILRVLHGARDLSSLLDDKFGDANDTPREDP